MIRALRNILRELELAILVGKEFQTRGTVNFSERNVGHIGWQLGEVKTIRLV